MNRADIPSPDVTGWRVIPDVTALRQKLQRLEGQQRGNYSADAIKVDGWRVVFDLRQDGLADGFVCERPNPDGSVASVVWDADDIRRFYPPRG